MSGGVDSSVVAALCAKAIGKQLVCVSTGDYHNAAICQDGRLWVWGRGDCGQLGLGDDKNRWAPKALPGFTIIHPDRTLRRNRKPVLKALLLQEEAAGLREQLVAVQAQLGEDPLGRLQAAGLS